MCFAHAAVTSLTGFSALGSVIFASVGVAGFLISALLLARLRAPARAVSATTTMGRQWVSGLRLARENRGVRLFMAYMAITGLAGGLAVAARPRNATLRALFGWGTVIFGLANLALFTCPLLTCELWPAIALIGLAGIPAAAAMALLTTFAQAATSDDRRGAVVGLLHQRPGRHVAAWDGAGGPAR
jgi:hypothetical protein